MVITQPTVGIMAFAWEQTPDGTAGLSNEKTAEVVAKIIATESSANTVLVSTQWEVDAALRELGLPADNVVSSFYDPDTRFVDSEWVVQKSVDFFQTHGITRVFVVGQPFHMKFVWWFLRLNLWGNFAPIRFDWKYLPLCKDTPFGSKDKEKNVLPYTAGPLRLVLYLIRILLTGRHGQ